MASNKLEQKFILNAQDNTTKVLNGVSGRFKKLGKQLDGFGRNMSRNVTAPLAAAAGALTFLGKKGLDTADRMDKLNKKTGASVEFLSQMRGVSELAGIEFENVAQSLVYLQKNMGDAVRGTGEAKEAFEVLGISLKDIQSLSPEDQFQAIYNELNSLEDVTQRNSLAMKIFGRSGAALFQMGEGMKDLNTEALKNYKITQEQAKSAAAFNDAVSLLKASIGDLALDLATSLAPAMKDIAVNITSLIDDFKQLNPTIKKAIVIVAGVAAAIGPLAMGLGQVLTVMPALAKGVKALWLAFSNFNIYLKIATVAIAAITAAWALWGDEIKEGVGKALVWIQNKWRDTRVAFLGGMIEVISGWKEMVDGLWNIFYPIISLIAEGYTRVIKFLLSGVSDFLSTTASMLKSLPDKLVPDGWIDGLENASSAVDGFGENLDLTDLIDEGKKKLDEFSQTAIESLRKARDNAAAIPDAVFAQPGNEDDTKPGGLNLQPPNVSIPSGPKSLLAPDESVADMLLPVEGTSDLDRNFSIYFLKFREFKQTTNGILGSAADRFTDNIADAVFEAENLFEGLKGTIESLGKSLLKVGLSFGLSFIPGIGPALSGGFRAAGGPVLAGRSYTVGENGREIFTPAVSGAITPESKMGSTNNIVNNISVSVDGVSVDDPLVLRRLAQTITDEQEKVQRCYR